MRKFFPFTICLLISLSVAGCFSFHNGNEEIFDIESVTVYESSEKPGHNAWPCSFVDNKGNLCVIFQQIRGQLQDKPSYDFRKKSDKYDIRLICMRAAGGSSKFEMLWKKNFNAAHSFFMPAPEPAPNGMMLGMCRPVLNKDFAKYPAESIVIVQSDDCWQNIKFRSIISIPGTVLIPNDIKFIGNRLYIAAYDGKGGAYLFYSEDNGLSWSNPLEIIKAHDNMSFHEPTFCELSSGDLAVVLRTHRMDIPKHNGINYHKVIIRKDQDGKLSIPAEENSSVSNYIFDKNGTIHPSPVSDTGFGFRGRPYLYGDGKGMVILVAPGNFFAFSRNDGKTWYSGMLDFNIRKVSISDKYGKKPYNWNAETTLRRLPDGRFYYSYFIGSDFPFPAPCDMYIGGTFFKIRENN